MKKHLITVLALLMAISPFQADGETRGGEKTVYYYNLKSLKRAASPEVVRMVNIENLSTEKQTIERGILFTCRNRNARHVSIAGSFSHWKTHAMRRSKYGVWYYFAPSETLREEVSYKFVADGIWITDTSNPFRRDDASGSHVSLVNFPEKIHSNRVTYRIVKNNSVEFRLYRPGARMVTVVGDFNNWNPENDMLQRQTDGIWRLTLKLPRGRYRYQYIVDGTWTFDLYNKESASNDTGDLCSVLTMP